MKGRYLMTEMVYFTDDGHLDIDKCSLDVYEMVFSNNGAIVAVATPPGFAPGGSTGLAAKDEIGLKLRPNVSIRLYAGNKYPRADQYDIIFSAGAGTKMLVVMLYGVPKNL